MKVFAATIATVLLAGCAHWFGPAHGTFDVLGSTPDGDSCELTVVPVGSGASARAWTVSGDFRQSVLINPSPKGHLISLVCDDGLVAERVFKYGRDVRIGGELEINGSAP